MKKLALLLLMAAAFMPIHGNAQEYIREMTGYLTCDTSIVRVKNNDSVIVCNVRFHSQFMIASPGVSSPINVEMNNFFVNDFEIVGNFVYFCGYRLNQSVKEAIVGHFNLSTFPNGPYFYYVFNTCTEFKKIDYYEVRLSFDQGYEKHLALTGSTGTRSNVIADMTFESSVPVPPPASPYYIRAYFSNDENESFDDVAVTDNYVVFSTRKTMYNFPVVDFWQFGRPTSLGSSFFNMPLTHLYYSTPIAETPVFLEHEINDRYAAVYRALPYSRLTMVHLTAPNVATYCLEILDDEYHTSFPMEIKYNRDGDLFEILARYEVIHRNSNDYIPMRIYHVTPDVINNIAIYGNGTRYENNLLWSLDPLKATHYFFASGASILEPRLFKYKYDYAGDCSQRFKYSFNLGTIKKETLIDEIPNYQYFQLEKKQFGVSPKERPFPTICPNPQDFLEEKNSK